MVHPPEPKPIFLAADQTDFSRVCDYCVHEKNSPFHPERGPFGHGSWEEEGILVKGSLPLDQDAGTFTCEHGHQHFVIRLGTETAANFGASN